MENISIEKVKIKRIRPDQEQDTVDELAVEEPLEIQLLYGEKNNRTKKSIAVTMRTPGNDGELAAGFIFTEGIIKYNNGPGEIRIDTFEENKILISLPENETPDLNNSERNFYTTSSCGVCGKASIDSIHTKSVYKNGLDESDDLKVRAQTLYTLNSSLRKEQEIFKTTGGLHASALFNTDGKFIMLREDVGRHNALDKVIGYAFLNGELPLADKILLLSGRVSFELIQKAAMAGIKIVAAVGAPSSLAVRLAVDSGISVIGFLRDDKFNIYSGSHRIITN